MPSPEPLAELAGRVQLAFPGPAERVPALLAGRADPQGEERHDAGASRHLVGWTTRPRQKHDVADLPEPVRARLSAHARRCGDATEQSHAKSGWRPHRPETHACTRTGPSGRPSWNPPNPAPPPSSSSSLPRSPGTDRLDGRAIRLVARHRWHHQGKPPPNGGFPPYPDRQDGCSDCEGDAMDPIAVAGLAGTALVGAMATDAWQQTRDGVVALWRRVHPERAQEVGQELVRLRSIVEERGTAEVEEAMTQLWQLRLRDLLLADPALTAELTTQLAHLTDDIAARGGSPDTQVVGSQRLEAHASGNGRVYQAARDIHITES